MASIPKGPTNTRRPPNPKGGPRGPQEVTRELTLQALDMHRDGKAYCDIAAALGVSQRTAYEMVNNHLKEAIRDKSEKIVAGKVELLESMIQKAYDHFVLFDDVKSGNLVVTLMDRLSKFLGLDQASKVEVSGVVEGEITPAKALELVKAKFGSAAAPKDDALDGEPKK